MGPPPGTDDWIAITAETLDPAAASVWAVRPGCGGVVTFTGTVRDHAEGRPGVVSLEYEAYQEQAEAKMAELAGEARRRWPELGRLALLHRVGLLAVEEPSVVVVASAPHRGSAFEAARWCIDTLKETVPIWKRESWAGGHDWGTGAREVVPLEPAGGGRAAVAGAHGGIGRGSPAPAEGRGAG